MEKVIRDVADRKGWLGGSSWGAALGLSTYSSPYKVYQQYLGQEIVIDDKMQEMFDMRHDLEGFISGQVEKKFKVKVKSTKFLYLSNRDKRLGCHPDRLVKGIIANKRIAIEIKTSSAYDSARWGEEDSDQVPYDYLLQCYSYFECVGVDEVWLVRFSDNRLTRYIIQRPEQSVLDNICNKLIDFMEKIDSGWIPDAVSYAEAKDINSAERDGIIEADEEWFELRNNLNALSTDKKAIEEKIDVLKAEIVKKIGTSEAVIYTDDKGKSKNLFTYKKKKYTRFDKERLALEHPDIDLGQYYSETWSYELR